MKVVLSILQLFISIWLIVLLNSCEQHTNSKEPIFHETTDPLLLSEWNVLQLKGDVLALGNDVTPYDLNTPLFTDYAQKLRTIWIPKGKSALYNSNEVFEFPIGTIISKTFFYPALNDSLTTENAVLKMVPSNLLEGRNLNLKSIKLIETRLLVRRDSGWVGLPYVWNDEQTDATLKKVGDIRTLNLLDENGSSAPFAYVVPNSNQCSGCHATNATTRKIKPIGPKARHLNSSYKYSNGIENQLLELKKRGLLKGVPDILAIPRNALWNDESYSLNDRARAYLDINCSHCHNKVGAADTSGLLLGANAPVDISFGVCKPPIAAGNGTGGRTFDIVPGEPNQSIMTYRMADTSPAVMMPELGRSLAHKEGVNLISNWILNMGGSCE